MTDSEEQLPPPIKRQVVAVFLQSWLFLGDPWHWGYVPPAIHHPIPAQFPLECAETTRSGPFARSIDISSLVVQDEYIFIQVSPDVQSTVEGGVIYERKRVTTGGRASYYVSYRREAFAQIKLPKYSLPKDMHIISTNENQVFAAVQEWNQNDTYNLYISDTRGIYFTLAMENIKSSRGLMGNIIIELATQAVLVEVIHLSQDNCLLWVVPSDGLGLGTKRPMAIKPIELPKILRQGVDIEEITVAGIKGIFLANKKVDDQVKTYITYNKGRDWRLLQAPDVDLRGNPIHCLLPEALSPGVTALLGNIGPELSYTDISVFISSDGGNTWRQQYVWGSHQGLCTTLVWRGDTTNKTVFVISMPWDLGNGAKTASVTLRKKADYGMTVSVYTQDPPGRTKSSVRKYDGNEDGDDDDDDDALVLAGDG
ncbi:VPS10 domain-containing receptor SorCS3 [Camelus dromedarius]|uniref:VPS10 domain-containing receptor SorCS3 n=1 Tax=Camelus dromedarius TaxID=9838 RepID=A0A5N4DIN4_CAMDR|nr:VPS10 domain-containing receptor SorCS3 [Camelus dromedarius]